MTSQHLHPGFRPLCQAQNMYPITNRQAAQLFYQGPVFENPSPPYRTSFREPIFEDEFSYHAGMAATSCGISSPDMASPYDQPYQTSMRRQSWTTSSTSQDNDMSAGKIVSVPKRKRIAVVLGETQKVEKRRIGNMIAARKFRGKRKDELETLRQMYSEQVDKNAALQARLHEALSAKYQLSIELVGHLKTKQQE